MKAEALPLGIFQLCTEAVRGKQGCHPDQPLELARISSLFSLEMQILCIDICPLTGGMVLPFSKTCPSPEVTSCNVKPPPLCF